MTAAIIGSSNDQVRAWTGVRLAAATDLTRRTDYNRLPSSERWSRVIADQAAYVDALAGIGDRNIVALRWSTNGTGDVDAYLLGRVESTSDIDALTRASALAARLRQVPDHCVVEELSEEQLRHVVAPFRPHPQGIAVMQKRVRAATPERPDAGVQTYVAVEPFARSPGRLEPMLEALRRHPYPVVVTVLLQVVDVPVQLRRALEGEATRFGRLAQAFDMPSDVGGRVHFPPDGTARTFEPLYLDALRRYTEHLFRFDVTVTSPAPLDDSFVEAIASTLSPAGGLTGPTAGPQGASHDPLGVPSGFQLSRPMDGARSAAAFAELQPVDLPDNELLRILTEDRHAGTNSRDGLVALRVLVDRLEAATLFRLPAAVEGVLPGFRVVAPRDSQRRIDVIDGPSVVLGYQDDKSEVRLAVTDLPRHGFIVGTPGSGKTNTALHLCRELRQNDVPFAVIEPVNSVLDDYRWLATLPEFGELLIFTVGDESVAPFRLNPFQVPDGMAVGAHISNLLACFEAAFGLWDPLPFLYRRALTTSYARLGFHSEMRGSPEFAGKWPVLSAFVAALADTTKSLGYAGEVGANIDAASRLRAESLAEGACGFTLDCEQSYDIGALMRRPVVFELAAVGDNAKEQALITLLLVNAMRGYYRFSRRSDDSPHVILLEEAHRIFPRTTATAGDQKEANAQAVAAERIAQGLAEDRKYRQSYFLIDQQVGKVAEEAYKITNVKFLHRTVAEEDRTLLGSTMSLHPDQVVAAASLRPFEALVSHNSLDQAVSIRVPNVRAIDAKNRGLPEAPLAEDDELRLRYQKFSETPAAGSDDPARHRCNWCTVANHLVSERSDDAKALFAPPGDVATVADRLIAFAGLPTLPTGDSNADIDYQHCVFVHAFRRTYPPEKWTEKGREKAIRWAARVRMRLEARQ